MQINGISNNNNLVNHNAAFKDKFAVTTKLIEFIILIKQATDLLSDKRINNSLTNLEIIDTLEYLDGNFNKYSKYIPIQHSEILNSTIQQRNEVIHCLNTNFNSAEMAEKYEKFAAAYSKTMNEYGAALVNDHSSPQKSSIASKFSQNDISGLSLLMVIMVSALDMLAINLMASNSYAKSIKLYQKSSDSLELLRAMAQKMDEFYNKLADKRQEILNDIKNQTGKYKNWTRNDFVEPGTTVSMDDKDFIILCKECGYPTTEVDHTSENLVNGFKEFLNSIDNWTVFNALKDKLCPNASSKNDAINYIASVFSQYINANKKDSPEQYLKDFLNDIGIDVDNIKDLCDVFTTDVKKQGPDKTVTFTLNGDEFPSGVEGFFKVIRDSNNKIVGCVIDNEGLKSIVKWASQQLTLVLPDTTVNSSGVLFDTYGNGLIDQRIITTMLPFIGNKSKQVQDNSSGLVNQISLCQQNVQVVANFFDKVADIFKELSR